MEPAAPSAPPSCWPLRDRGALFGAVASGQLDGDLPNLIDVVNHRMKTMAQERRDAALARVALHDRVRIGNSVKPQYLRGETGTIHEIDGDVVVVYLDRVVGKFSSRHASCPPETLEVIREG